MTLYESECYEFGDFALFPKTRLLTRFDSPVEMAGKDFEILLYLVINAGQLINDRELTAAVWGDGRVVGQGNITNHISKIRRTLKCDPQNPKFIATSHGKRAYRFIAQVTRSEKAYDELLKTDQRPGQISIEAHLIAPVFLGIKAFENMRSEVKSSICGDFKEFRIDGGRLQIAPTGIGVWHLEGNHVFNSFTEAASWRKDIYEQLLNGKHVVQLYNQELKLPLITRSTSTFAAVVGRIGYVLSILGLIDQKSTRPESRLKRLQLLSNLGLLEKASAEKEQSLLDGNSVNVETIPFGSAGHDIGFASWDGVSLLEHSQGETDIKKVLIDFEIAVQSTWWLAKCLYDSCLEKGSAVKNEIEPLIDALKWQHARLRGIAATESAAQRTMIEAILKTSRLDRLVADTLVLFERL